MLVPAVTVPISLIATFIVLLVLGFSINLLTLLALVLAIGLVVDDAIVVLENIHRRIDDYGETPLVAAFAGTRQVGFAVVATTVVLIAVFVPIAFLQGDVGRLFSEFALTMAAAIAFSAFVALTVSPMLASKILQPAATGRRGSPASSTGCSHGCATATGACCGSRCGRGGLVMAAFVLLIAGSAWLLPAPAVGIRAARGPRRLLRPGQRAGGRVLSIHDRVHGRDRAAADAAGRGRRGQPAARSARRAPSATTRIFNTGIVVLVLNDWAQRRSGWAIMDDVRERLADLSGVRAFPVMRQGFGASIRKPVQFVIGGGT